MGSAMPAYEYRCDRCGEFEERRSMGTAAASASCPGCGRPARRVWSPPLLARTPAPLAGMLAREEQSRDAPQVVERPPPRRRRAAPAAVNPAQARLPRP
jgi:putative FmdB family regulatory protein